MLENSKQMPKYSLLLKTGVAAFDQAILSITNLAISIILIKNVPKEAYGYYSIAFSISLLFVSFQNAVVTTPLSILLIKKSKNKKKKYISSLCFGQFIFVLPAACFCLLITSICYFFGIYTIKTAIGAALSCAAIGILFREFLRAYLFAEELPVQVLKLDLYFIILYLGMTWNAYFFFQISVVYTLLFMGISAFITSTIFSHGRGWKFNWNSIRESYSENWQLGKWSLVGILVTHIQKYSYLYMLGVFMGGIAVADLSASRLLMMPFLVIQAGWGKIVRPHGAKLIEYNRLKCFFKEQVMASLIISIAILLYIFILEMFSDFLQKFLFTDKYKISSDFILFWGAIFLMSSIRMNASFGLQVIKKFSQLAKVNTIIMIITVCSAYFLIKNYGAVGGLSSLLLGESLLATTLWVIFSMQIFSGQRQCEI